MKVYLLIFALLFLTACGQSSNTNQGENLLKAQQEAMEKAEQVEEELQESLEERMKQIEGN